tara:strand:+ start:20809 stop:23724 length:2916 start_codon:yes stop_codon:yes gene_type:complete
MSGNVKINGVNMFINKLEFKDKQIEIINLNTLKTKFKLDEDDIGFYKLSLYIKNVYDDGTITENYNRPGIGPIEVGTYCSICQRLGDSNHENNCDRPRDESLFLTLGGFRDYILNDPGYSGDYLYIKEAFLKNKITDDIVSELFNLDEDDEIIVKGGKIDIEAHENKMTNIEYEGRVKKRGPSKLPPKTTTTQFLNNLIISHEIDGHKTSIRISKNGLINIININTDPIKKDLLLNELIKRINSSGAVNYEAFSEITGETEKIYKIIPGISYIHSASGQFTIKKIIPGKNQVNFIELNDFINPYDINGKIIESPINTKIKRARDGSPIVFYKGLKIIEWEYYSPRETRNEIMTKEYIKIIVVPIEGLKLTAIINKYGSVMLNISKCTLKQKNDGLCGNKNSDISIELFDKLERVINEMFDENEDLFVITSLSGPEKQLKEYNTVSGYAPNGRICRLTRTRKTGDDPRNFSESMRPEPYSWSGTCPDPNYQYLKPEGVFDPDDKLWYPCCETKDSKSIERMKEYLRNGFPGKDDSKRYDLTNEIDYGSGILVPNSNLPDSIANVKINGKFENVRVIGKLSAREGGGKKANKYKVEYNGEKIIVSGEDFERDSRIFPGLNSFNRDSLLSCIFKNLKINNLKITEQGRLEKKTTTIMNENSIKLNTDIFLSKINPKSLLKYYPFTYHTIPMLIINPFDVRKISSDGNKFYLVLSPQNNFYINDRLLSVNSDISDTFRDTIIFEGYLSYNDILDKKQYEIIDIIYNNIDIRDRTLTERNKIISDIFKSDRFSSVVDEIIILPDEYSNIISGSYEIINSNPRNKLVFKHDNKTIVFGDEDNYRDTIVLQILEISKETIKFGYDSKEIIDNNDLDFLRNYTFLKRNIPTGIKIGDYYKLSINRDSKGNVVNNRILNIKKRVNVNPTTIMKTFDEVMNILLVKFSPINSEYFNSNLDWVFKDGFLRYDGTDNLIYSKI